MRLTRPSKRPLLAFWDQCIVMSHVLLDRVIVLGFEPVVCLVLPRLRFVPTVVVRV